MRQPIKNLIKYWDNYLTAFNPSSFEIEDYEALMIVTFEVLKEEVSKEKIEKDIPLLFSVMGSFIPGRYEDEEKIEDDDFYRMSNFHLLFMFSMYENEYFRFNEKGDLLIKNFLGKELPINPKTFDLPSLDELLMVKK